MESSAAGGDPRPSSSGGSKHPTPPPQPPPPLPGGWLAGLVSGAGRLLASVLGPDSSHSGAGSTADEASDGASPSASSFPSSFRPQGYNGDHVDSLLFPPKNNHLNQSGKETVLKDYAEASLAIVSDIEPKDAIMQLLMQETYSRVQISIYIETIFARPWPCYASYLAKMVMNNRTHVVLPAYCDGNNQKLPMSLLVILSECSTLIKIIQERVVNPDSGGIVDGGPALLISANTGRQPTIGYSSFSPNASSPSTSSLLIHGNGIDNRAAAGTAPTLTTADQGFFNHNADKIKSVLKRSYSVAGDTPKSLRRVRPKINGSPLNISNFKQVDVIRTHPAVAGKLNTGDHNSSDGFSQDDKKLLSEFPLVGTNNFAYPDITAKIESVEEILDVPNKPLAVPPQHFDSSSSQAGGDPKNYDSTFINSCSNRDLKNDFPLKVESLNVHIPFEQKMMDLSLQKREQAACDDSCSVSKLMFMEDIEAAPSLPTGVQLQNCTKNRKRKQLNSQRTTPTATGSPAKGTRRKNIGAAIISEIDSLEQSTPALMEEQDPDYIPEKRPVGRPRKGR